MTRDECKMKVGEIKRFIRHLEDETEKKVDSLESEIDKIKREYVLSNQPYPIGTKIKIEHIGFHLKQETRKAVIVDYDIDRWSDDGYDIVPEIKTYTPKGRLNKESYLYDGKILEVIK